MKKAAAGKMFLCFGLASSIALTGCSVGVSEENQDKNASQASAQHSADNNATEKDDQVQTTSGDTASRCGCIGC